MSTRGAGVAVEVQDEVLPAPPDAVQRPADQLVR